MALSDFFFDDDFFVSATSISCCTFRCFETVAAVFLLAMDASDCGGMLVTCRLVAPPRSAASCRRLVAPPARRLDRQRLAGVADLPPRRRRSSRRAAGATLVLCFAHDYHSPPRQFRRLSDRARMHGHVRHVWRRG